MRRLSWTPARLASVAIALCLAIGAVAWTLSPGPAASPVPETPIPSPAKAPTSQPAQVPRSEAPAARRPTAHELYQSNPPIEVKLALLDLEADETVPDNWALIEQMRSSLEHLKRNYDDIDDARLLETLNTLIGHGQEFGYRENASTILESLNLVSESLDERAPKADWRRFTTTAALYEKCRAKGLSPSRSVEVMIALAHGETEKATRLAEQGGLRRRGATSEQTTEQDD